MLKGYITLISGVATGIGKATATYFLKQGATVIGVDKTNPNLEDNKRFIFMEGDIKDERKIVEVLKFTEDNFGKLDSLVTIPNAIYKEGLESVNSSILEEATKNILYGPILFTKHATALLRKSENPSITHDISIEGFMIGKEFLNSILSSALINYVKQSSPALKGIRVNGAIYGMIANHLLTEEKQRQLIAAKTLATIPSERLGTCEEVAKLNSFLASNKARYLNSATITVDGGWYITHPRAIVQ